jgi:hypothetical protein
MFENADDSGLKDAPVSYQGGIVILFVFEIVVAVILFLLETVSGLAFDACSAGTCNYELGRFAWWLMPIASVVIVIGTLLLGFIFRSKGRAVWWLPLCGIVAMTGIFIFTQWLIAIAANPIP